VASSRGQAVLWCAAVIDPLNFFIERRLDLFLFGGGASDVQMATSEEITPRIFRDPVVSVSSLRYCRRPDSGETEK